MTGRVDERRRTRWAASSVAPSTGGPAVDVIAEIARELIAMSAKAQALELALQRPDFLVELLRIDVDVRATAGAAKATLRAEASELALRLLGALRAGNSDLVIVDELLEGHFKGSAELLANTSEARPAESCPRSTRPGGADGADR